ncbi:MAG: hypothetical protein H6Q10_2452, partial [Acidobacteria bacterium]|nr:hypothetical protein [Acidobacteriota bacterium]
MKNKSRLCVAAFVAALATSVLGQ